MQDVGWPDSIFTFFRRTSDSVSYWHWLVCALRVKLTRELLNLNKHVAWPVYHQERWILVCISDSLSQIWSFLDLQGSLRSRIQTMCEVLAMHSKLPINDPPTRVRFWWKTCCQWNCLGWHHVWINKRASAHSWFDLKLLAQFEVAREGR